MTFNIFDDLIGTYNIIIEINELSAVDKVH